MSEDKIAELFAGQEHLHDCVEALKVAVRKNTEVTEQVRDILGTFRVTMAVAKWVAAIVGAIVASVAFLRSLKGG